MDWINIIAVAVILLVIGAAVFYIVREKKRGKKCIGCPYADSFGSCTSCGKSKND